MTSRLNRGIVADHVTTKAHTYADTPNLPTLPTIKDYFAMMAEGQAKRFAG
ncbi:MAG: hypothetical protein ABSC64_21545 [Candidatus Korobacteraceae bacterium]